MSDLQETLKSYREFITQPAPVTDTKPTEKTARSVEKKAENARDGNRTKEVVKDSANQSTLKSNNDQKVEIARDVVREWANQCTLECKLCTPHFQCRSPEKFSPHLAVKHNLDEVGYKRQTGHIAMTFRKKHSCLFCKTPRDHTFVSISDHLKSHNISMQKYYNLIVKMTKVG